MSTPDGRPAWSRRGRGARVDNVRRWATATVTGAPRMWWHRLGSEAGRTAEDWEVLPLPDHDRPLPGDPDTVQHFDSGTGPLHRRRYRQTIATDRPPDAVVDVLDHALDGGTPDLFVRFVARDGGPLGRLDVGDEALARMTGPADGPIRCVEREPALLRFVTLGGHPEAGEIVFRAEQVGPGRVVFEVASWARSSSVVVRSLYERGGGRDVQRHVWTSLCRHVAGLTGRAVGRVEVLDRVDPWPPADVQRPGGSRGSNGGGS